jgi:hypothetical protein
MLDFGCKNFQSLASGSFGNLPVEGIKHNEMRSDRKTIGKTHLFQDLLSHFYYSHRRIKKAGGAGEAGGEQPIS